MASESELPLSDSGSPEMGEPFLISPDHVPFVLFGGTDTTVIFNFEEPVMTGGKIIRVPPFRKDSETEKSQTESEPTTASLTSPDEAKINTDGMSLPCRVCGDKSTGLHYGVNACEGCKGFFRRSIQKQIQYKCHLDGECSIERMNRNRCQHCRFKKCLAVGMSKGGMRIGRYTKEIKKNQQAEIRRMTLKPESAEHRLKRERREIDLYSTGERILQAYQLTKQYSKERVEELKIRRTEIMSEAETSGQFPLPTLPLDGMTEEQQANPKLVAWKLYMDAMMPGVKRVVEFAKCLPDFENLKQEDQVTLLKAGFFEAWIIQLARVSSPTDKNFILEDDQFFSTWLLNQMEMDMFWNRVFEIATRIQGLDLGDLEIALMMGVTIFSGDRVGLIEKSRASSIQEKFIDCFQREIIKHDPKNTMAVAKILALLPKLISVSMMSTDYINILLKEHPDMEIPDLLVELLDLNSNLPITPTEIGMLPLSRLVEEGGLFNPPKAVACVPTFWPNFTIADPGDG